MVLNPPSSVMEDQTDEEFFDKLVDDDFEPTHLTSKFGEGGSDSDEAKAFANLTVEDVNGEGGLEENSGNDYMNGNAGLSNVHLDGGSALSSAIETDGFQGEVVSDGFQGKVASDLGASKDTGSMKLGVKEVGWSSFHSDMLPNGSRGVASYSDFFNDLGDNSDEFFGKVDENAKLKNVSSRVLEKSGILEQHGDSIFGDVQEAANGQDLDNSQHWENAYPGWKYDTSTGQWYQVDSFDTTAITQGTYDADTGGSEWSATSNGKIGVNYLQQSLQSVGETEAEASTTECVSSWNHVSQGNNNGYPEHMVFDLQYPGWYYDMLAQEWRSLESYASSMQTTVAQTPEQQSQNGMASGGEYSPVVDGLYNEYGHSDSYNFQEYNSQAHHSSWGDSYNSYNQQGSQTWQLGTAANTETFGENQPFPNSFASYSSTNNHVNHHKSVNPLGRIPLHENVSQGHNEVNGFVGFVSGGNFGQHVNQKNLNQNEQMSFQSNYYSSQTPENVPQQAVHSNQQFSYAPNMERSSAGRPPHSLVTFGFGGKIIVMKDSTSLGKLPFSPQEPAGNTISVLNLMEVVLGSTGYSSVTGGGSSNYFSSLCQKSFPGPLVGGSVGNKEVNKWIDERIANCESPYMDYRKGEVLKLLLSLLKIACQHYGKLRSPFGSDASLQENNAPESAVAKLFASVKSNGTQMNAYGALGHCLQNLPFDGQVLATASEVQNLLVSGRKKEALQYAQEGQLWGPALVLASQLGDQFFVDTVKQMALHQLVAGSPLRTLCLLIAGQPAEVFSSGTQSDGSTPGALNVSQQPQQSGGNVMLDDWEKNLAVITANRTKDDELVIIHLGDCLWKDRSEITSAHICYLVAEANFEPYSDTARLCLLAADHWKHPRTYASPEAIQRTELYEYSKVLGNSQFILLPFQPYKLIYAYMLAEVGKVSDSLKYCQAVLKLLKTGRASEVETWKQLVLSLEERLRTHQQGGYATNLAPAKLVGKLLNFFDSTAHRVVGGLPPPASSMSPGSSQNSVHFQTPMVPRVSSSQSTMAMSSLMSSSSMEPIGEWAADGNKRTMHNRSVSEPDFGRSPRQVDSSNEGTSPSVQGKSSSSGSSRFGCFGFGTQLFQKTVGRVLRPRSDKQAKLGESNKFYYDEKLKRWVEEGAEPPTEEAALPAPPTTSAFQNGAADYSLKSALMNDGTSANGNLTFKSPSSTESTSGIPPIPTNSNQFSARGRMGVRARYVDTFNQGGASSANLFHSHSVSSVKPAVPANAKFFIPSAAPASDHSMMEAIAENVQEDSATAETSLTSTASNSFCSPTSALSVTMQRFPSVDNLRKGAINEDNGPISSHSRQTASWSGTLSDAFSPPKSRGPKLLGEALNIPPSPFTPIDSSTTIPDTGSSFGDLHEVEL